MSEKGKETRTRDAAGVRKNEYRRFKAGEDYEKQTPPEMAVLCDMMKRGIFGEEETPEGVRVRHAGGRPWKYETVEQLQDGIEKYIDYIATQNAAGVALIPDVEGLALFLGVSRSTLYEWQNARPGEFSDTLKRAFNAIAAVKKQLALAGKIPPIVFATDFNNNHGYIQQSKIEVAAVRKLEELPEKADILRRLPMNTASDPADDAEISADDLGL
ncbi:MAG: DNA-packaging protein [Lachnospiraceae bacterium]|nr:DNA-packaging protein [Lachnospiraceae bacterium]